MAVSEQRISRYTGEPARPYRKHSQWQREDVLSLAGHGYPQTEISRLTGIPYTTVRTMLFNARKRGDPRAAKLPEGEVGTRISLGHAKRREAQS